MSECVCVEECIASGAHQQQQSCFIAVPKNILTFLFSSSSSFSILSFHSQEGKKEDVDTKESGEEDGIRWVLGGGDGTPTEQ